MACGALTPPITYDAGSGGGATTGGGAAQGGGDGAGGGGDQTGGGSTVGGGSATGGGTSGFTWVNLSLQPAPTSSATVREVRGLAREDALWVLLNDGSLYRADAGALTLSKLGAFDVTTSAAEVLDLVATDAGVFVVRSGDVLRCAGACNSPGDFAQAHDFIGVEYGYAACSHEGRVIVTSRSNAVTKLYEFNHDTQLFEELSAGSISFGERCAFSTEGDLLLPSSSGVVRLFAGGGSTVEPIDAGVAASWRMAAMSGNDGLLVGGGSGIRFARRNAGAWLGLTPITVDTVMQVVLPLKPGEFLAAGSYNGSGGVTVYREDGSMVAPVAPQPSIHAQRGVTVSADEVYLGGAAGDDASYVVIRGTR